MKNRFNGLTFFDGSIGTSLHSMGLEKGKSCEEWNIERPEKVLDLHASYVALGVDVITSNTFGGTARKLANTAYSCEEINRRGIELAQEAVKSTKTLIAGSVGPTGALIEPLGLMTFQQAYNEFKGQMSYHKGADFLILETFSDIVELKAAMMAARDLAMPFIPSMTFEDDLRTISGTPPSVFVATSLAFHPIALGLNCGSNPLIFPQIISEISKYTDLPILAEPNAGIPKMIDGVTVFPDSPKHFVQNTLENIKSGASIVGGCCGTTPEHIKLVKEQSFKPPILQQTGNKFLCASRTKVMTTDSLRIVGERINPAGKAKLKTEINGGKLHLIRQFGILQSNADALDVNVSTGKVDEYPILGNAVKALSFKPGLPLFIDSGVEKALEHAFENCPGRAVLNSITGKKKDMKRLMPIAKKWGTAFVALPLDENGIPDSPEARLKIAQNILQEAKTYGFEKHDMLFDPIVLPLASGKHVHKITRETLKLFKANGLFTIAGVSNVSFGMPNRKFINLVSLLDLKNAGLDIAIFDPQDELTRNMLSANLLLDGKISMESYIPQKTKTQDSQVTLEKAIEYGYEDKALQDVKSLLAQKLKPLDIIHSRLIPAIQIVGDLYEKKQIYLPSIIISAQTVKTCMNYLQDLIPDTDSGCGKIILATVEGDIHDIGKNLLATVLQSYGYSVIDLGKDVPKDVLLEAIKRENPQYIGLSALMTTTMPSMTEVTGQIRKSFPDVKIIIGGATVDADFAKKIGAHAYAKDAIEATRVLANL